MGEHHGDRRLYAGPMWLNPYPLSCGLGPRSGRAVLPLEPLVTYKQGPCAVLLCGHCGKGC